MNDSEKIFVSTVISDDQVVHDDCLLGNTITLPIKHLSDFIQENQKRGATHLVVKLEMGYDRELYSAKIYSEKQELETDEQFDRRISLENDARQERLKYQEKVERDQYEKLKQKFDKK